MRRATVGLAIFACLLAAAACADSTGPRSGKAAPTGGSHTRYILASGDVLPPGCEDLGDGYWLCDDGGELTQPAGAAGVASPVAPATPDTSGDSDTLILTTSAR